MEVSADHQEEAVPSIAIQAEIARSRLLGIWTATLERDVSREVHLLRRGSTTMFQTEISMIALDLTAERAISAETTFAVVEEDAPFLQEEDKDLP